MYNVVWVKVKTNNTWYIKFHLNMLQVFLNRKDIYFIFMQMQIFYQIRKYHKDLFKEKY